MDDITKKLSFNNSSIKLQAINKLLLLIEKKKPDGETITKSTPKIPEFELLWKLTNDDCPVIRNGACRALVSLAIHGHAEMNLILDGIFNHLPSTKCLNGFILAVRNLLIMQSNNQSSVQISYQQRLTQHLFVVVLKNNPHVWPYLLEQVKAILQCDNERQKMLQAIVPFLEYILWDPNKPLALLHMRQSIGHILGNLPTHNQEQIILKILIESCQWIKLDSCSALQESVELLQILSRVVPKGAPQIHFFISILATVCLQMIRQDFDPCTGLQALLRLLRLCSEEKWNLFIDAAALLIASMLEITGATNEVILLELAELILSLPCVSSLIRASFVMPLLQIMAIPVSCTPLMDYKPSCQQKAATLIRQIEKTLSSNQLSEKCGNEFLKNASTSAEVIHPCLSYATYYAKLARTMEIAPYFAYEWLEHVNDNIQSISHEWKFLTHVIVGILVHGLRHKELTRKAVSVLVSIAQVDNSQAPSLFPVLLHKLGLESDIELRLHILQSLPDLATHKIAVGPVLQTLLMLSSTPSLQALSIRLTSKLWHHQDRVFPFLNRLLVEPEEKSSAETEYDVTVAKAASIKEICIERPELFGRELLPNLSSILTKNLKDSGGVPSVLALGGIISLCKSEVIDLHSTWKVLSKKMVKDTRPQVVKMLCELLALAPDLEINNLEFESFRSEIISYLWKQVNANKNPVAVGAAYRALAKFSPEFYKFKHLPEKAKEGLKLPLGMASTPLEQARKPEDVLTHIPASCFLKLLQLVDSKVLPDYGYFLSRQISEEVKGLPRGVYHSSLRLNKVIQSNKVLAAIPLLLAKKQEYNKVPGLQGSLAAGVLLSFEPKVEYGRNGEPLPRSFANQASDYEKRLEILLNEVPIGAVEWQRSLALLQAWSAFIERLFFISVEGRKAELEMQKTHGTLPGGETECTKLKSFAWLYVRDRISDILKCAARGKPVSQGNAILGLGALAAAIAKFVTTTDEDVSQKTTKDSGDHMAHDSWMALVCDTIMSVIDPAHARANKSRIFTWFQGSEKSVGSLSMLVRGCAAIALAFFAPSMTLTNSDKAGQVIDKLMNMLESSDSPAIQLYAGLGLGIYISHLYQQHFVETGGVDARNLLNASMRKLMQYSLTGDVDSKVGSVLGLTLATSTMCLDLDLDTRLNAKDVQSVIKEKVEGESPLTVIFEVLSMGWVCITTAACITSILSLETAEIVLRKLEQLLTKNPDNCGVAASLGFMIHWLQRISFPNTAGMKDHLLKVWLPALASESAPTMSRLSALYGLCSLFGLQNFLLQLPDDLLETDSDVGLNELLHLMSEIVSVSKDIGMQNCCAWMLGQLYTVTSKKGNNRNSLPLNYSYLNDSSFLRATVDYINDCLKIGETEGFNDFEALEICLETLSQSFPRPLPPLNWATLLAPFIRSTSNDKLKNYAILIALNQTNTSIAAASVMTTCISSTGFNALQMETQCAVLQGLPKLLKGIPVSKIQVFLEAELKFFFQSDNEAKQLILATLQGIKSSLSSSTTSSPMIRMLHQVTESIYNLLKVSDKEILVDYCKCLKVMPAEIVEQMTTVENLVSVEIEKALCIRCQLVAHEGFPITWLNCIIDTMAVSESPVQLDYLYKCLRCLSNQKEVCLEWLLGIIRQTKSVVEWKSNLQIHDIEHMCQVVTCLVDVFATAVLAFAHEFMCYSPSFQQSKTSNLEFLPLALQVLLVQPPYCSIIAKVIEWMIGLCENGVLNEFKTNLFQASLMGLRHHEEFKKASVWTHVLSLKHSST